MFVSIGSVVSPGLPLRPYAARGAYAVLLGERWKWKLDVTQQRRIVLGLTLFGNFLLKIVVISC